MDINNTRRLTIVVVLVVAVLSFALLSMTTPGGPPRQQRAQQFSSSSFSSSSAAASSVGAHEQQEPASASSQQRSADTLAAPTETHRQQQPTRPLPSTAAVSAAVSITSRPLSSTSSVASSAPVSVSSSLLLSAQTSSPSSSLPPPRAVISYLPHPRPLHVITVSITSSLGITDSAPLDRKSYPILATPEQERARAAFFERHSRQKNSTAPAAAERDLVIASLRQRMGSLSSLKEMASCSRRIAEGKYWRYGDKTCADVDGFFAPLRSYEVGVDELSCSDKTIRSRWRVAPFEKVSNPDAALKAIINNRIDGKSTSSISESIKLEIEKQYSRFVFYSSWLFKQYRPWRPAPFIAATATTSSSEDDETIRFRSHHDPQAEGLLRLENFCIDPVVGYLSGYGAAAKPNPRRYLGVDDTAGRGGGRGPHNEPDFRDFVNNVYRRHSRSFLKRSGGGGGGGDGSSAMTGGSRGTETIFFDERPVVLFPAMHLSSHNMAHSHFKFWSLLGLLKINPFSSESASMFNANRLPRGQPAFDAPPTGKEDDDDFSSKKDAGQQSAAMMKPLIVFVLRAHSRERHRARAFGFMYQMLDLPWVVSLSGPHDDGADNETIAAMMHRAGHHLPPSPSWLRDNVRAKMVKRTSQVCESHVVKTAGYLQASRKVVTCNNITSWVYDNELAAATTTATQTETEDASLCFRRGVVWANCLEAACETKFAGDEAESFNFYNYQPINTWRRWMMARYESLLNRCLPIETALPLLSSSSHDQSAFRRPKIFFDVRSASRGIDSMNLMMDWVRTELIQMGFASDVIFRELWKGSRGQYLDDIRTSDVFAGVHGGSFAVTMMLRPKPVVVEYAGSWSFCRAEQSRIVPVGPYCWFIAQVEFKDGSHWIYQVPTPYTQDDRFAHVGSFAVIDSLKEASCRWFMQHYGVGVVNASLRRNGTLTASNSKKRHFSGVRAAPAPLTPQQISALPEVRKKIPTYCLSEYVKYSDMSRLHVRLRERAAADARELQFLLQKFFALHISISDGKHLLKLLSMMNEKLHLSSATPEIFQFILTRFVHPGLVVFDASRSNSSAAEEENGARSRPQLAVVVACLRADSSFAPLPPLSSSSLSSSQSQSPAAVRSLMSSARSNRQQQHGPLLLPAQTSCLVASDLN